MLSIGLAKIGVKELIGKVVTSAVFLIAYANKRNTCRTPMHYGFDCLSMLNS